MYKKAKSLLKKVIPKPVFRRFVNQFHYFEVFAANLRLGFPGRKLKVIGITGTSGKSTTVAMLAHILNECGRKTAYFSTTNAFWGGRERENKSSLTTETALNLYRRVKAAEQAGDEYLIAESSAHAVVQHRLAFLRYRGAAFTNLSHDHLDYFGDMATYARAKQGLFKLVAKNNGWGVFKSNDDYTGIMEAPIDEEKRLSFGLDQGELQARDIKEKNGQTTFKVVYGNEKQSVSMQLTGQFNVENALAAIGCALKEGIDFKKAVQSMETFSGVKGRMERFETKNGAHVLVDFAHTPDAFELVLSDLRKNTQGAILAVYGGYGNRDHSIREPFGRITATYCDHIILTEDTVYDEQVSSINKDIKKGIASVDSYQGGVEEIEAREEAIARAISLAKKGDVIALLGKGHESTIPRAGGDKPWDEIAEVKKAITAADK